MSNAIVYEELKEKARTMPMVGIFYAFDNEQFVKGCIECGYLKAGQTIDDFKKSDIKLIGDGFGGYGTREAFDNRNKQYEEIDNEIRQRCQPDDIFRYEFWNYECYYTMDYEDALKATRHYFPKYKPSKKLVEQLMYGECR